LLIFPILIPSKGRPQCKTAKLLKDVGADKYLFVEPQDKESYEATAKENGFKLVVLPENNGGVAYVRELIRQFGTNELDSPWYWMMDDDIQRFSKTEADGKLRKVHPTIALTDAQEIITKHQNIAIGALTFGQYAFGEGVIKKPFQFNKRVIACTLHNAKANRGVAYDLQCALKEDIDYTIQILKAGYSTMILNQIAISVPSASSLKGGCYDEYQRNRQNREKRICQYLQDKWGKDIVMIKMKDAGIWDVKLNYEKLSRRST